MSNLTHIIIPIVKNKPTLHQLNVFQPSTLCLTPQKDAPLSRVLVDKKYSSAFKRYKQKKERKEPKVHGSPQMLPQGPSNKPKKPLKIKIRQIATLDFNKNISSSTNLPPSSLFYDPNQAPLYTSDTGETAQLQPRRSSVVVSVERMEEEIQVQLQQKLKGEGMEEENQMKYVEVQFRHDDPFIIIKKTQTKKVKTNRSDNHLQKTKIIKKDKNNTPTETEKRLNAPSNSHKIQVIPVLLSQPQLTLPSQNDQTFRMNLLPTTKEVPMMSLECILKESSVDDSAKSQEQEELAQPFLMSREGVMS